jgi:nitrate reductase alpha subunit
MINLVKYKRREILMIRITYQQKWEVHFTLHQNRLMLTVMHLTKEWTYILWVL